MPAAGLTGLVFIGTGARLGGAGLPGEGFTGLGIVGVLPPPPPTFDTLLLPPINFCAIQSISLVIPV